MKMLVQTIIYIIDITVVKCYNSIRILTSKLIQMEVNLFLLVISVVFWGTLFYIGDLINFNKASNENNETKFNKRKTVLKNLIYAILLCIPFNYNGDIYTVLGNAKSENNIYSVMSFYQNAKGEAFSFFSIAGYQKAKTCSAGFSVLSFKEAENSSFSFAGILNVEKAKNKVTTMVGLPLYMKSKECNNQVGLTLFMQEDGKTENFVLLRGW